MAAMKTLLKPLAALLAAAILAGGGYALGRFFAPRTYTAATVTETVYAGTGADAAERALLRSERDALKEELRETLSEATGQEVAVTFDLGVYRGIRPGMSEEEKTLLFKEAGVD